MSKKVKQDEKKKKDGKRSDTEYAHNPSYCMILPDAEKAGKEDEIVSTGQS